MPVMKGRIMDAESRDNLPGASIVIEDDDGRYLGVGTTSKSDGTFYLDSPLATYPNWLKVTYTNYTTYWWELDGESQDGTIYLNRKETELPDIVVTGKRRKKDNLLPWLLLGTAVVVSQQKNRSISGVNAGTVTTVAVAAVGLLGFDLIAKMLQKLGVWQDKDDRKFDSENANPNSYWHPAFYKAAPTGAFLLTTAAADDYIRRIKNAFGWFNDDENEVYGVFREMKTKSQISFLSDRFLQTNGSDFLNWLKGGDGWPNDRLGKDEIAHNIMSFTDKLPNYKP